MNGCGVLAGTDYAIWGGGWQYQSLRIGRGGRARDLQEDEDHDRFGAKEEVVVGRGGAVVSMGRKQG